MVPMAKCRCCMQDTQVSALGVLPGIPCQEGPSTELRGDPELLNMIQTPKPKPEQMVYGISQSLQSRAMCTQG